MVSNVQSATTCVKIKQNSSNHKPPKVCVTTHHCPCSERIGKWKEGTKKAEIGMVEFLAAGKTKKL